MSSVKRINVFLRGGLGNQLFQYSTGLAISKRYGKDLVLRADLLPLYEDAIGGISRWPNQISTFRHTGIIRAFRKQPTGGTNATGKLLQFLRIAGDLNPRVLHKMGWLSGEHMSGKRPSELDSIDYVNSYSPYKDLAAENRIQLSSELNNIVEPTARFLELSTEILKKPTTVVHIRQGDYLNLENTFGTLTMRYLSQALETVDLTSKSQRVWLFTDSPNRLQDSFLSILRPERIIGPADLERPIENLVLMSKGAAIVAANSTFSWWACFIANDRTAVIAPNILSAKLNNFASGNEPVSHWEFIDVD